MEAQLELYMKWAPDDALWTQWVKPVVFMNIKDINLSEPPELKNVSISWIDYQPGTAVIVDLPGISGIDEGLGLARLGYRPIPLYNGVPSPEKTGAAVSMDAIVSGLCKGSEELLELPISLTAQPVFLLDSRRMEGTKKKPGNFDNRWCVVPQDMPSAHYFLEHQINRIVVRTGRIMTDLQHILYQYQQQGIDIYVCDKTKQPVKEKIRKSGWYGSWFYRFLVVFGLVRNAAGGFGAAIPLPSENSEHWFRAG